LSLDPSFWLPIGNMKDVPRVRTVLHVEAEGGSEAAQSAADSAASSSHLREGLDPVRRFIQHRAQLPRSWITNLHPSPVLN
jgi:hypothetical protein